MRLIWLIWTSFKKKKKKEKSQSSRATSVWWLFEFILKISLLALKCTLYGGFLVVSQHVTFLSLYELCGHSDWWNGDYRGSPNSKRKTLLLPFTILQNHSQNRCVDMPFQPGCSCTVHWRLIAVHVDAREKISLQIFSLQNVRKHNGTFRIKWVNALSGKYVAK